MGKRAVAKVVAEGSLTERILKAFPRRGRKGEHASRRGVPPRSDIVNEQLCDDVIKYLAPTLEPYKGCTIVDINPGACLWSDKLHQYLKPKRHILMEPDKKYVESFLKPLLLREGSTYSHTNLCGINSGDYLTNWNEIFNTGELIGRERLPEGDPNLRRVDTSLLVTGSLTRRNEAPVGTRNTIASQLAFLNAAWMSLHNGMYHQAGLVRSLWWIPEPDKVAFFPNIANYKYFSSAAAGFACNVNQLVAIEDEKPSKNEAKSAENERRRSRHSGITTQSAVQVQERMALSGMSAPQGRKLHTIEQHHDQPDTWNSPAAVRYDTLEAFKADFDELTARVEEHPERGPRTFGQKLMMSHRPILLKMVDKIKYKQVHDAIVENPSRTSLTAARNRAAAGPKAPGRRKLPPGPSMNEFRMVIWADFTLNMINLEVHYKLLEEKLGLETMLPWKTKLISLQKEIDTTAGPDPIRNIADASRLWEDILDLAVSPPILLSDRRQYEPLQAQRTDFHPSTNVVLLDMTPIPRSLSVPSVASQAEVAKVLNYLLKILFSFKNRPLPTVLDRIAPNAAQDLIPLVPEITDPRQGGRLDPMNLKVRQMTDQMFEGLAKAWVEWPFKPETHELALEMFDGAGGKGATTTDAVLEEDGEDH